jgi:hypothetical protein
MQLNVVNFLLLSFIYHTFWRGCRGCDRMIVGFTTFSNHLYKLNNFPKCIVWFDGT